ncbi:MAG: YitT family protein [Desulfobacteraceae bacterium]|nr:YitT family protein [Desulfobacteraceae bacterium]
MPHTEGKASCLSTCRQVLWNLFLIAAGSLLCALSINGILIPQHFVSGGVTGLILILRSFLPDINFGFLYLLFNVPLYLLAFMHVGRRFFLYSLAGLFIFAGMVGAVQITIPIQEKILAALAAGILLGTGSGVILRSYGSTGGTDILSILLLRRFSVKLGNTTLAVNGLVLVLAATLFSLEAAIYTVIYIYVSSRLIDLVVTGLSQRKAVFIISQKWQAINNEILKGINRGVTVLKGEGGYTGREERILYTVITFRELGPLKQVINRLDPAAFVVVNDTLEVMDERIGNQPHW